MKHIVEFDIGEQYGPEYKGHYVVKRYTWATRNRIIENYTQINPVSGKVVGTDKTAVRAELILVSLAQQPRNASGKVSPNSRTPRTRTI